MPVNPSSGDRSSGVDGGKMQGQDAAEGLVSAARSLLAQTVSCSQSALGFAGPSFGYHDFKYLRIWRLS